VVNAGETLYSIARKYEMEVNELMRINDKKDSSLSVGEELTVYKR
jgi:LysM repeat protein